MANKRLTDLTEETDPASSDVVAIDGATTRKVTRANLLKENLEAIRGLTSAADKGIQFTGAGTADVYDLTSAGKALLDDADAAAQRATLGLAIGTDVQAHDASLADVAGITFAQGDFLYHNGTNLVALAAGAAGDFLKTQGAGANPTWDSVPGGGDVLASNQLTDVNVLATGVGAVARTAANKLQDFVSITDFGAKGDGLNVTATVSITSGMPALTATGATFTSADVGKTIVVPGAGAAGVELITTIASFTDATHVGLTDNAATTLAAVSKTIFYGTDNTTAINGALAAASTVMIPNGNFGHSGTLSIATSDRFLVGMGRGSTTLTCTSKTLPAIQSGLGITNWGVRHLTTTRAPVATSGATGIYQPSSNDHGYIDDLLVTKHYVGLIFSYTGYSRFTHSDVSFNVSHGIQCLPDTSAGGTVFQWNLDDILSSQNGGDGFNIDASAGTGGAPMGNWVHVSSFLNTGVAMRFLGSASNAITNIRIAECFVGGDGGPAEIVLDTYNSDGFPHTFTDCCLELGSAGFSISSNNGPVILNNPWVEGMTGNGIIAGGRKLQINGGHITYNATGISVQAGQLQISNCIISNVSGGAVQQYGIAFAAATGPHLVRGCDFNYGLPNVVLAIFGASTIVASSKIESNIGYNPVGGGVVTSTGAQPYNYTAGPSAEDAYISVSTGGITGATVNGGNILTVAIGSNVIFPIKLPPGGTLAITGSFTTGTLVHCRFIH